MWTVTAKHPSFFPDTRAIGRATGAPQEFARTVATPDRNRNAWDGWLNVGSVLGRGRGRGVGFGLNHSMCGMR